MKKHIFFIAFLVTTSLLAQTGLRNTGQIQVHDQGQLGFHTNFINDGIFDQNTGLVGFYGDQTILVRGSLAPTIYDFEILAGSGLQLLVPLNIVNNVNFILGDVFTLKNNSNNNLNFLTNAFYAGESVISKVDGFAAINNKPSFIFPVGDPDALRPLQLNTNASDARCAYLFENPSAPTSFDENFNTNQKAIAIEAVSPVEFWILENNIESRVTLGWDARSGLGNLSDTVDEIIVVGWLKSSNRWVTIPHTNVTGNLTEGFITTANFIPDDFAALTFGSTTQPTDTFAVNNPTLGNYFLSPNNDGVNDFLIIDGMDESPNNSLRIFNRTGQIVYEKVNYIDGFNGVSNINNLVIKREIGLPEGVYYYIVSLDDLSLEYQGFIFLDR